MKRIFAGILLAAILSSTLLVGCSGLGAAEGPASVDSKVLDKAITVMDAANGIVEALNSGWPQYAIKDAFTNFDAEINWFKKMDGPDQMPEFYAAISDWRSLLDKVGTSESKYTESRQIDQLGEVMATAKAELDAALDAAGR
ncbi:MAG: hypothetical protein Q8K99_05695 [Actinomycetota bacterium]|nr:hypothetical protein [Actinomycetota bacterium]